MVTTEQQLARSVWANELRKDSWVQGKEHLAQLEDDNTFSVCCLGVKCIMDQIRQTYDINDRVFHFYDFDSDNYVGEIPLEGWMEDVGMTREGKLDKIGFYEWVDKNKNMILSKDLEILEKNKRSFSDVSLAILNDRGISFRTIANIIEFCPCFAEPGNDS